LVKLCEGEISQQVFFFFSRMIENLVKACYELLNIWKNNHALDEGNYHLTCLT
jgi:hypothetical protein